MRKKNNAHRSTGQFGPDCLTAQELEDYSHSGDLPLDRLDHIGHCPSCDNLLSLAASPPDFSDLIGTLIQYDGPASPVGMYQMQPSSEAPTSGASKWMLALLLGISLTLGFLTTEFRGENARLQQEIAALDAKISDLVAISKSMEPVSRWSEEKILEWFSTNADASEERQAQLFLMAESKHQPEAICKASTTLAGGLADSNGKYLLHTLAARNFLRTFEWEEIVENVRKNAHVLGEDPDYILSSIRKSIEQ